MFALFPVLSSSLPLVRTQVFVCQTLNSLEHIVYVSTYGKYIPFKNIEGVNVLVVAGVNGFQLQLSVLFNSRVVCKLF